MPPGTPNAILPSFRTRDSRRREYSIDRESAHISSIEPVFFVQSKQFGPYTIRQFRTFHDFKVSYSNLNQKIEELEVSRRIDRSLTFFFFHDVLNSHSALLLSMISTMVVIFTYEKKSCEVHKTTSEPTTTTTDSSSKDAFALEYRSGLIPNPMDPRGKGKTVIRDPTDIAPPINVYYTPQRHENGSVVYFEETDSNGLRVPIPMCQTDLDLDEYLDNKMRIVLVLRELSFSVTSVVE